MKDSTKRILLIGGSVLVIGGVIYYLIKRARRDTSQQDQETPPQEVLTDQVVASSSTTAPSELNTTAKIKAFQDWMDTIGPWVKGSDGKYKLLNKGAGYGNFGPSTSAAWNYYKSQYLKPVDTVVVDSDKDLKTAIDYLVSTWLGDKVAFRKRLLTEKRGLVIAWASALQKYKAGNLPKNAFKYAGRIYDVNYGKQRIYSDPIGREAIVGGSPEIQQGKLRALPTSNSSSTTVSNKTPIGKVASYKWNMQENLMYLYVPNNGVSINNKWIWKNATNFWFDI